MTEPTKNLWIQESFVNQTEGYRFGDSPVMETSYQTPGEVYRYAQREYGRCISKVYHDQETGPPIVIGWVFEGRDRYEDTGEIYLREVWVTLHDAPETRETTYHYHELVR